MRFSNQHGGFSFIWFVLLLLCLSFLLQAQIYAKVAVAQNMHIQFGEPLPSDILGLPDLSEAAASDAERLTGERLSVNDQLSLGQAISRARREIRRPMARQAKRKLNRGVHFFAFNPYQHLGVQFMGDGARIRSTHREHDWAAHFRLDGVGDARCIAVNGTRLEYDYGDIIEWYDNRCDGIEQGFILKQRPTEASDRVSVRVRVDGLAIRQDGETIRLADADGNTVLSYGKLKVWDADGRILLAELAVDQGTIQIAVNDAGARYPITVDPLIGSQEDYIIPTARETVAEDDRFGSAVAISGDTVVIGVPYDDENGNSAGCAYVFVRNGVEWQKQQKLLASDGGEDDLFGWAVAIHGDSLVVGANGISLAGSVQVRSGCAYVFVRNSGVWSEQQKLMPPSTGDVGETGDIVGSRVAIYGDTVAAAAPGDQNPIGKTGSVLMFQRTGTTWDQNYKVHAGDFESSGHGDFFGSGVSLYADTLLVGARNDDDNGWDSGSVYVFTRDAENRWPQQDKFYASDGGVAHWFGCSVSVYGDTAVIGACTDYTSSSMPGSAYIFKRIGTEWIEQQKLLRSDGQSRDAFGLQVSIDGNTAIVGCMKHDHGNTTDGYGRGTAYIYKYDGADWALEQSVTASDAAKYDEFSRSVAVSGDTAILGSHADDDGGGYDQGFDSGSAYVFVRGGTNWTEQRKIIKGDPPTDNEFGAAISFSADTLVVGAPNEGEQGPKSGNVYVFTHNGTSWAQQQRLTSTQNGYDSFGEAVSVSGDTLVVGASGDDGNGYYSGSAYVFVRSGDTWTLEQKLIPDDGNTNDYFGRAVAVSNDTIVVGATGCDDKGDGAGCVYIFERSGTTWSQVKKLCDDNGAAGDSFGASVAVLNGDVIVGASGDDGPGARSGSVQVYTGAGTSWTLAHTIVPDAGGRDPVSFGKGIVVSGGTALISCSYSGGYAGAYAFDWNGSLWVQKHVFTHDAAGSSFACSLTIDGDIVVLGAKSASGEVSYSGCVFLSQRTEGNWGSLQKISADDGASSDYFGQAVSVVGNTLAVGSPWDDSNGYNSGGVYVYKIEVARDFGDLPALYGMTTEASEGAVHLIDSLYLGDAVDHDADGQESSDAGYSGTDGDDGDGTDDEDGIAVIGSWQEGTDGGMVDVTVNGGGGYLSGWIDWNHDGDFSDSGEHVLNMLEVLEGRQTVSFDIPQDGLAVGGGSVTNFARFRLSASNSSELTVTGSVDNGEVEDYLLLPPQAGDPGFVTVESDPEGEGVDIGISATAGLSYEVVGYDNVYGSGGQVLLSTNATGAFTFTDDRVTAVVSRYYQVVEIDGEGTRTTNPVINAVHVIPLDASEWYRLSIPVDVGAGGTLDGELGDQLKTGLFGHHLNGDLLYIMGDSGNWSQYLLDGNRDWIKQEGADVDVISACQGFWVKRRASGTSSNALYSGRCYSSVDPVAFQADSWHMIAWPFPAARLESENWGFADDGAQGGSSFRSGDNIIVDDEILWLHNDGRWRRLNGQSAADKQLKAVNGYYYKHRGAGFTWTPEP